MKFKNSKRQDYFINATVNQQKKVNLTILGEDLGYSSNYLNGILGGFRNTSLKLAVLLSSYANVDTKDYFE